MKKILPFFLVVFTAGYTLRAEILEFDVSPPGTSPQVGLSFANEVPPATGSGSGNEVFTGIVLDDITNQLSVSIGYGTYAGFTNLTGPVTAAHIHGPAGVGQNADPVINLLDPPGQLVPSPDPFSSGGLIVGVFQLTQQEVNELKAGLYYINLHTGANPGGEIRGQIVEHVNTPPSFIECPRSKTIECTSPDGMPVNLTALIEDVDGDDLKVVWTVNGDVIEEMEVPSGGSTTVAAVDFSGVFPLGTNTVVVTVLDDESESSCELTVKVQDTTPPVIKRIVATPRMLWPPNHKMKIVRLTVDAEDRCGKVRSKIVRVRSNEPVNGNGDGNTAPDWKIRGDLVVSLRAERAGGGSGRIYTIFVRATDESGNSTVRRTQVRVPHSRGRHSKHR